MRAVATPLLFCFLFLAALPLSAAELLTFRGTFAPIKGDDGASLDKAFTVQLLRDGDRSAWTLAESGRGAWPWVERFGTTQVPSLLYDRGDGFSTVPLPPFFVVGQELAADGQWEQAGLRYRVVGGERAPDADAWRVVASDAYGPKRSLLVAKVDRAITRMDERVFVGQGQECRLQWELVERKTLDAKAAADLLQGFEAFAALRGKLALTQPNRETKWNAEQRKLLSEELPPLLRSVKDGPLVAVLQAAEKDLQVQDGRSDALAALQTKAMGKMVEKFTLEGTSGEKLTNDDLKDVVTVLHFWDYRDTPLEEPYGQVGYLDYLARQNKSVKVYGVMVDDRLDTAATRGQALGSARKVKSFMNLSYPVLLDDAELLKQIGDPRTTGAKLPLFVIVGKNGKILHYHSGFYEVKRDEGLAELKAAIEAAQ